MKIAGVLSCNFGYTRLVFYENWLETFSLQDEMRLIQAALRLGPDQTIGYVPDYKYTIDD